MGTAEIFLEDDRAVNLRVLAYRARSRVLVFNFSEVWDKGLGSPLLDQMISIYKRSAFTKKIYKPSIITIKTTPT